jgi:NAD(P)-dependent dehydrogenase (short-subunit alcohol dehydrogenase family)
VETLVSSINGKHGPVATGVAADVTSPDGPSQAYDAAQRLFGSIDIVVYNAYALEAGHNNTFSYESVLNATEDDWNRCFQVNVLAPYRIAQALVPRMREQGYSSIALRLPRSHRFCRRSLTDARKRRSRP